LTFRTRKKILSVIKDFNTELLHFVKLCKSAETLKKLQKSGLFIDDKLREATMIVGHLKKQKLLRELS